MKLLALVLVFLSVNSFSQSLEEKAKVKQQQEDIATNNAKIIKRDGYILKCDLSVYIFYQKNIYHTTTTGIEYDDYFGQELLREIQKNSYSNYVIKNNRVTWTSKNRIRQYELNLDTNTLYFEWSKDFAPAVIKCYERYGAKENL